MAETDKDDLCTACDGKGLDPNDYTKYCGVCGGTPSATERKRLDGLREDEETAAAEAQAAQQSKDKKSSKAEG